MLSHPASEYKLREICTILLYLYWHSEACPLKSIRNYLILQLKKVELSTGQEFHQIFLPSLPGAPLPCGFYPCTVPETQPFAALLDLLILPTSCTNFPGVLPLLRSRTSSRKVFLSLGCRTFPSVQRSRPSQKTLTLLLDAAFSLGFSPMPWINNFPKESEFPLFWLQVYFLIVSTP